MKTIFERFKSPIVWMGIASTIIAVSGINPSNMTDWATLGANIAAIFQNPFLFFSCAVAVYSYLNNPADKAKF